ncbi:MAG: rod shape-determining protein RodA [Saprospiraceae bacterium]|nr:rod shape-determining protein RodA [Saprospiraceae bacterium]MCB9344503.1 rod shape-determining protein RodA [Lewinellaceae bacterium]
MSYTQSAPKVNEVDRQLIGIYLALVALGWFMIYSVTYNPDIPYSFLDMSTLPGKQLMFMVICFGMMLVIMLTDWTLWRTFSIPIYLFTLLLLPGTLILGREVNGAHAWYQIGGFTFQPAELAKFGTCLAMAGFLSSTGADLREWRTRLIAFSIFMLPVAAVILQKDTGSALVFFSFALVLYREGLSASWYALSFGAAALVILGLKYEHPDYVVALLIAAVNYALINRMKEKRYWWIAFALLLPLTFWWEEIVQWFLTANNIQATAITNPHVYILIPHVLLFLAAFFPNYLKKNSLIQRQLQAWLLLLTLSGTLVYAANFACNSILAPHQQQRIKIWLNPEVAEANARGSGYNLIHSKMAIGAGGFLGKGPLQGNMTKLKYVPKQSTDYIFCTVGEEHGFVGVTSMILLFLWLLYRITVIAERQRSNFSRIYAYGVAGIIFVHFAVNIGMTMGLMPTIGIPLPFVSYGGSSLIGFTLMIAVLIKLDSNRNLA